MSTPKNMWDHTDDELLDGVADPAPVVAPVPVVVPASQTSMWDAQEEPVSPAPIPVPRIPDPVPVEVPPKVIAEVPPKVKAPKAPKVVKSPKVEPELKAMEPPSAKGKYLVMGVGLAGVSALALSMFFWLGSPATDSKPVEAPSVQAPAPVKEAPAPEPVVEAPAPEAPSIAPPVEAPALAPAPVVEAPSALPEPVKAPEPAPAPVAQPIPPELIVPKPPSVQDQVAKLPPLPPGADKAASETKKVAPATAKPRARPAAQPVQETAPDSLDLARKRMDDFLARQRQQGQ